MYRAHRAGSATVTASVLVKDTSSVPNTHVGGSQAPLTAAPAGLEAPGLCGHLMCMHSTQKLDFKRININL